MIVHARLTGAAWWFPWGSPVENLIVPKAADGHGVHRISKLAALRHTNRAGWRVPNRSWHLAKYYLRVAKLLNVDISDIIIGVLSGTAEKVPQRWKKRVNWYSNVTRRDHRRAQTGEQLQRRGGPNPGLGVVEPMSLGLYSVEANVMFTISHCKIIWIQSVGGYTFTIALETAGGGTIYSCDFLEWHGLQKTAWFIPATSLGYHSCNKWESVPGVHSSFHLKL